MNSENIKLSRYVVGFLFDSEFRQVALIRKQKPQWQAGLLNGIGGKIEYGENNDGSSFECYFFFAVGEPALVSSREIEQIELHDVCDICGGWEATIGNLPWLVALARDFGIGKCPPKMVTAVY